jgi:hypothetical protein
VRLLALVSDQVLATINSIELLGIIYLAIAVSKLRERVARSEALLEAYLDQRRDHDHERGGLLP